MDGQILLDQIPILYVRGTYRVVGYTIGRQFKSMIDDLVQNWDIIEKTLLPAYETAEGKLIYDDTLRLCRERYPQYIEELEGIADGSQIPFHKLFLLHIESVIAPMSDESSTSCPCREGTGCTSVMCNNDQVLLGHTEDALVEFGNNVYVIAAEIIGDNGEQLEKFTTLTYAGHLPGYTMGFNKHFVYSINTQFPKLIRPGKTPRTFLTRAILGATNREQVFDILRDAGAGTSDGFSLNIIFWSGASDHHPPILHNIEVSPSQENLNESELSILPVGKNEVYAHCNKYLRLKLPEHADCSAYSENRHEVLTKLVHKHTNLAGLKTILSDCRDKEYPIFRSCGSKDCPAKTVAVGIFDILKRTWSIYMGPPSKSNPVAVLHLDL